MSFSTLQELKNALTSVANNKGHSSTNPVSIAYNNADTGYEPVRFVVSHVEPYDLEAPLNLLWYVTDPASPQYDFVLRRTARSASGGLQHTWESVTDVTTVLDQQIWDTPEPASQDALDHAVTVGNPHMSTATDVGAIAKSGDKLAGMLETRTLAVGEDFDPKEVVPRSWVDFALNEVRTITTSISQSFNNTNSQIDNLRTRVEVLEASILGFKGFVYRVVTAASTWSIAHNMNKTDLLVQVYEGNEMVWPSRVDIVDANNVSVEFAVPVAGRAELLPIVERT
jgi:hypothetical protein